ncbi:ethanolamine utilization protein EutP [Lacrimispora xylanisolvens]|uniref:Ethanolamine utilization protein EutP n=1 Tax=Lacrimispora xylanisolvens TaxID=384636 RepID=A0A2S6HYD7_9FIRM|nr:ethanolamine utilization protein EutP [Paenibacillaceae bacterium]PPK83181.1 ethanolamine utilization protein EutP [Hungatella xylanolytica]
MRKKRIMIIGPGGSGKTALAAAINGLDGPVKRTQNMVYGEKTLDVPGVYLESPWMHKHIIAAAQDASHVLMLVDQSSCRESYPPGFAKAFRVPVIGVITGSGKKPENDGWCIRQLKKAGISTPCIHINLSDRTGIDELMEVIKSPESMGKSKEIPYGYTSMPKEHGQILGKEGNVTWSNL